VLALGASLTGAAERIARAGEAVSEAARADAKKHFRRGVELYEEQDYRGALAEFERAYEIAPSYKVLYNVGQTQFQLQSYPKALDAFDAYLEGGGAQIAPARRKEVEDTRAKLRARIATLDIRLDHDAKVSIDGQLVGAGRAFTVRVGAGQHVVGAEADGYLPLRRELTATGEDRVEVALKLVPVPPAEALAPSRNAPPPAAPSPARSPGAKGEGSMVGPFVALGVTGALAVGTVAFGVVSLSKRSTFEGTVAGPTTAAATEEARESLRAMTITTDVFLASTIVSGVVTVILFASRGPSRAATGALRLDVGPSFVGARTTF